MAIRSTNANRRGGTADDLARDMKASKGRGSSSSGSNSSGRIDYRDPALNGPFYPGTKRQEFRDDPNWRYQHTPGSDRGAHTGYKPSVSPKTPWVEPSAEWYAQDEAAQAQRRAEREQYENSIPGYAEAKAAGDWKTAGALRMAAKDKIARDKFIAQGGTEETYRNRFNRDWPKPRSPLGAYSHGPGSADWDTRFTNPPPPNTIGGGVRRGATPTNAPMSAGMPPSRNPMFEGYQGGGAGVPSGGSGVAGTASTASASGGSKGKATPMPAFVRSLWGSRDWRTGEAPQGGVGMIEGYIPDAASTGAGEASPRGNQGFFGSLDRMARSLDGLRAEDMIPGMELPVDQSLGGFAQALKSASSARKPVAPAPRGIRRGGGRVD